MSEFDPSGTAGWQPNSGNVICNGWNGYDHILCSMIDPDGVYELYGADSGTLRWYQYQGAGGWHPNFRNIIGGGW